MKNVNGCEYWCKFVARLFGNDLTVRVVLLFWEALRIFDTLFRVGEFVSVSITIFG